MDQQTRSTRRRQPHEREPRDGSLNVADTVAFGQRDDGEPSPHMRDAELANIRQLLGERNAQLADAWDKLSERNRHLDEAWAAVKDRDERAIAGWTTVAERNTQLEAVWGTLAERNAQLEAAWGTLAERDDQLEAAWATLADHDRQLDLAWATLAERDAHLEEIGRILAERDTQLEEIARILAERDARLDEISRALTDRDRRLDEMSHTLTERDTQLAATRTALAQRDEALRHAQDTAAEREAQVAELRAELEETTARMALLQHYADLGAVYHDQLATTREQLATIQSSSAYALITRVIWPISRRVPGRLRRAAKRGLRAARRLARGSRSGPHDEDSAAGLACGIDTDLTQPLTVGKGSVMLLRGWCYHPRRRVRRLEVVLGGVAYPVPNYGIVKPDVLRDQAPRIDQRGHSLTSGFVVVLPLAPVAEPCAVPVSLRATLGRRRSIELPIGSLTLLPEVTMEAAAPLPSLPLPTPSAGEPLVAVCMATYNPPPLLFRKQIESIRRQSHQNWICIVNDDCSPDDAYRMICETIGDDARFFVYRNASRAGFYHNFEAALRRVPPEAAYVALSDQDDEWYPDKLRACLAEFASDTMLVYTDQDIATESGDVLSHSYWMTRKNNFTDFTTLLFANTVTGAASVFRASLLHHVLPFPPRVGDSFHDHWIATVAMAKGRLGYIDRPMYAYTQHGRNVLGHYAGAGAWRLLPRGSRLLGWARDVVMAKRRISQALWSKRDIYFNDVLRLVIIADTLRLRLPGIAHERRRTLDRFSRFDRSLAALLREGAAYALSRRPTLGAEWYCLRGAIANRALNAYYGAKRRRIYRHQVTLSAMDRAPAAPPLVPAPDVLLAAPEAAAVPSVAPAPNLLASVEVIQQKIAPLTLDVSEREPRRVNLLVPTIDFRYLFGGYIGKLNLALQLKRQGYDVRMVIVDWCDYNPAAWRRQIASYDELRDFFDQVEVAYAFDRSLPLPVHPLDAFIATTWWTAHIAHQAVQDLQRDRFIYLIQEYEPMTFAMGSFYALADETYTFPHYALFSTELLRDYFRRNRLGVFAECGDDGERNSAAFENAIHAFTVDAELLRQRSRRRLLFYARPEQHAARNMFELGMLALRQTLHEGVFTPDVWEFHGIGTVGDVARIELAPGVTMRLLPRVSLEEYLELLPQYDVGLSLMLTPHPSLVPLEMAGAGMLSVTNTYANKTAERLTALSRNVIAVPPTVQGVAAGLAEAAARSGDIPCRVEGSRVSWATTWDEALGGPVMERLRRYLAGEGADMEP